MCRGWHYYVGLPKVPGYKFRFCVQQMIWCWDHMSHPGLLNWFDTGIVCQHKSIPIPQSCVEIEFGLSLPFCLGPLPPLNEPYNFLCEMAPYIEICYAYGGGQPCRERQPLWNSHDCLNLTSLDQCHRVRSHGKSSSQCWRKRIVIQQSEFSL